MMYSLTAVGGIQYTTEMANKSKTNSVKKDTLRVKVREEIVQGSGGTPGTTVPRITTDTSGTASVGYALCPSGLMGVALSGGAFVAGTQGNIDPPHLRKLYNLGTDFRMYRILSGKLVFVPNYGPNTTGQLVLSSSRDIADGLASTQIAYASASNYRIFNMSQVNKEFSIPLDVDASWKKVTGVLSVPNNSSPFTGPVAAAVSVNMNTVNDLCFTGVGCTVNSAPATLPVGILVVEYEVEFKGLIDSAVNI